MKHHTIQKSIIGIGLFAGCFSSCLAQENKNADTKNRPNVLFIPIDDLRPELGCYGDTTIKTPNIDRIAKEGVVFTRTYCQQAVCNPSRASLLTGMRPDAIQVWDLKTDFRDHVPNVVTLPQYFKDNGYSSVGLGKTFHNTLPDTLSWSEKPHIHGFPFDPDAVYASEKGKKSIEEKKQHYISIGKSTIDQLGHWYLKTFATEMADVPDDTYFDGAQTTLAIEKLQDLKDKKEPFFLSVGYYRPHLPFNAPKKYWDMYDRDAIPLAKNQYVPENSPEYAMNSCYELRYCDDFTDIPYPKGENLSEDRQRLLKHGYFASVSYVDAQIGRLLDALEEQGLKENTIIVLWGDHGWKLGEHNSWCKQSNYEIDTRSPMIISGAGVKFKGQKSNALTEFVDVYPTLCELAGLNLPENLEGSSLVPLLDDTEIEWKDAAYSQFMRHAHHFSKDPNDSKMGYTIRTNRYRYVEWYNWDIERSKRGELVARELYDHFVDEDENINKADSPENNLVVEKLSIKLKEGFKWPSKAKTD